MTVSRLFLKLQTVNAHSVCLCASYVRLPTNVTGVFKASLTRIINAKSAQKIALNAMHKENVSNAQIPSLSVTPTCALSVWKAAHFAKSLIPVIAVLKEGI